MRRRLGVGLALAGLLGGGLVAAQVAGAALQPADFAKPIGFYRFCADAQLQIAQIDEAALSNAGLSVGGEFYEGFDAFVLSKSGADPNSGAILTTSFVEYADAGKTQPKQIRCKLRTSESLTAGAWPPGSSNNQPGYERPEYFGFGSVANGVSGGTGECRDINQNTIDGVWSELSPTDQGNAQFSPLGTSPTLVTTPDVTVIAGPQWVSSFPTLTLNGSVLEVPSKALYVPTGLAGTAAWEGAHYCTLVAPDHLRNVLLGLATP